MMMLCYYDTGPGGAGGQNCQFFNKNLIGNGSILGQEPPGGDDEDLAQKALGVKIDSFLIRT